ncbi:SDR family oxidoreductase [Stakelama pacifica]|uniref:3-oxoacyl-[acyl-carrier protein] reductase n=1 Tax=Stakelama pacifica TaxID=517720 RepID=A0A4R6FMN2_9SPHN|nr:SDR family oxidoreductase [Stakelama pacifica]TDN82836.1 3-oxoacyl-[acyl-carrier protein] reductase [Stakelama pacifica]GGO95451.1 3-ketoacyl-ACP reductase [Stakelama pacifica]
MSGAGQVAIVTGGSGGIGRETVLRLAASGYDVVASYSSSEQEAQNLVRESEDLPGTVVIMKANVAETADVAAMFDKAEGEFGGVDVLVTAAGIFKPVSFAEADEAHFDREMAVNLKGTFLCLVEAAKRLRDGGRIVAISTTTLALKPPGYGIYNAAKGAIEAMIAILAKEVGGRGITANCVAPGPVETEFFLKGKTKEEIAARAAGAPAGRLGMPDDIADTIELLVSDKAQWVNGQSVRANGGMA